MKTKNATKIECRGNKEDNVPNVRIRITTTDVLRTHKTTAEVLRTRIFVLYNNTTDGGCVMDIYDDYAKLENSCTYRSLIPIFEYIAEVCNCAFSELAELMLSTDKLLNDE